MTRESAFCTLLPRHAPRSNIAAVTARRLFTRPRSSPPLADQAVAVGLRCGKANTKTPRYSARIDPVFAPDSSGRSVFYFPSRGFDQICYLVSLLPKAQRKRASSRKKHYCHLPEPRAPEDDHRPASSFSTKTHMFQATSAPVVDEEDPTLRDGPVVTPRPPAGLAGRYSRKFTQESRLSLNRNSSEPLSLQARLKQFS